jgi:aminoglycoside phosphotransferase (APT) family kinase protein
MNQIISETTEVREQHRFNTAKLENFMRDYIDGFSGRLTVRQFKHGQSNPTYVLSDKNRKYVMRKKPPGKLLPSAHAVDREYRIISTLRKAGVPVAKTYTLCEDDTIIGTAFYIMELVEGRVFRDATASEAADPEERKAIFDSMNDVLAKIHTVDWKTLGLEDFGKPGNYMSRQISRWTRQYQASRTRDIESMNQLMQWMPEHVPADDSTTVVHGDFRLENLIIHPSEPRVVAVLDWELSTLGHPLSDLAYNCMGYRLPSAGTLGYGYKDHDLDALGVPSEADYVAAYCRRTGRDEISNWEFYMAFSTFRFAAIVQGVYKRGLDGIASSETADTYGTIVQLFSDLGWQIVCKECK